MDVEVRPGVIAAAAWECRSTQRSDPGVRDIVHDMTWYAVHICTRTCMHADRTSANGIVAVVETRFTALPGILCRVP